MEALPNGTGKRPGERIGQYFQVLRHNSGRVMDGMEMEIFHYGYFQNGGVGNQTRQKVTVVLKNPNSWLRRVDDKDRLLVYDTPPVQIEDFWDTNMEGAPVVWPGSNVAIGINSTGALSSK